MLKIKTFSDGDVIHLPALLLPQMCKVPRQVCVFIKLTFGHHLGNVVRVKLLLRCDCDMKKLFTSVHFIVLLLKPLKPQRGLAPLVYG